MKEVLKVEGMSCNHCVKSIETSVGALTGVSAVKVDLADNEVLVEYSNEETLAKVKETIEDQGFDLA
ncbi:heavy-metal-associated domain-containing protein [Sporosarcina sp. Marseille-Q4063]|uniref:copper ion binding protein n=1 Tax=Sporosarcina sp. Marseille-Q4063 TaxID=2810514 RepID=UPI001BAF5CCA|nr:copper ion binding protein [Sporosarcina sp. Marseille-Q4063]QUW20766.1 heavy-metal-associated domain-containing protein [Sporosarcina sp. Marseille-Q4063]